MSKSKLYNSNVCIKSGVDGGRIEKYRQKVILNHTPVMNTVNSVLSANHNKFPSLKNEWTNFKVIKVVKVI